MLNHLKQFFWANLSKHLPEENLPISSNYLKLLITDTLLKSFTNELKEGNAKAIQELYMVADLSHAVLTKRLIHDMARLIESLGLTNTLPEDFSTDLVVKLLQGLVQPPVTEQIVDVTQNRITAYCSQ